MAADRARSSLAERKAYPLSDTDIERLLPGTPSILYSELEGKALNDITDANGNAMILFVSEETPTHIIGHWLALLRQPGGVLMFDPYGGVAPDPWYRNAQDLTEQEREETDQTRPVLEGIIRKAGYTPLFNRTAYQQDKQDINTCGRHCVVRIWNAHMNNQEYTEALYTAGENPDTTVTKMTDDILQGRSKQRELIPYEV
jgi:hypothetical protein